MKYLKVSAFVFLALGISFGISLIFVIDETLDPIDEFIRLLEVQISGGLAAGLLVAAIWLVGPLHGSGASSEKLKSIKIGLHGLTTSSAGMLRLVSRSGIILEPGSGNQAGGTSSSSRRPVPQAPGHSGSLPGLHDT